MAENVIKLQEKLEAMSTPHCKTNKTNLWDVAVSVNRTNAVPLDKSSIIFEDDVTKTEGNTTITIPGTTIENAAKEATAYPGQIISGLGGTDGKVYVLQPDNHKRDTHIAKAGNNLTYSDQTRTSTTTYTYEELAPLSTVEYKVNKEAYERQVANNARKNTETQIAKFILENTKSVEIQNNGNLTLSVPEKLSDGRSTPTEIKTLLDYVKQTVDAEVQKRYDQDKVLLSCINDLDLQQVVLVEETTRDGILTLRLTTKLRDSSSDIVDAEEDSENTPLRKYND